MAYITSLERLYAASPRLLIDSLRHSRGVRCPLGCGSAMPVQGEAETTEIEVLSNGKTQWTGTIDKLQTRTISIPEGPFTVISKVYNPNLKMKEDIRTETHTRQCLEHVALTVPLFSEPQQH